MAYIVVNSGTWGRRTGSARDEPERRNIRSRLGCPA